MKSNHFPSEVIIIGGGLCGLLVADRLQRLGISCLVLEAGRSLGRNVPTDKVRFEKATAHLLEVDDAAWRFQAKGLPYDWIRVRALGGRSLVWGGWCDRMVAQNFHDARNLGAPWPISLEELTAYYRLVERRLRVRKGAVSAFHRRIKARLGLEVIAKRSALIPTKTRALNGLDLPRTANVLSETVALQLETVAGKVRGVEVLKSQSGTTQWLSAKAVVLCASPIETARILLASDIRGDTGLVGKGLVDHLVATCMVLLPYPAEHPGPLHPLKCCSMVPRFVNVGRRRHRNYPSGFTTEVAGPIALNQLGTAGVRSLGFDAKEAKNHSYCLVHAIGEVFPHKSRLVTLAANERDSFGRAVPVVHLSWCDQQRAMAADMDETVAAVADALAPPNSRIIRLRDTLHPGGTSHEAGTAMMADNSRTGVTDPYGAVFSVQGLYIADASVMPTALDRHPTLTLLALALRTADRVVKDFRHGI